MRFLTHNRYFKNKMDTMSHQNLTTCSNCLHKTPGEANKLVCLVTGKTVEPGSNCENYAQSKRDSQEIAQFGYESEKDYFSTKLYNLFAAYIIGIILGSVFLYIGYSTDPREHVVMIVLSVLVILVSAVFSMVLLYNLWNFIISELKKHNLKPSVETPGKAVGFLFIPFFNFYWIFKAIGKLPVDLNRIARARIGKNVMANEFGIILCITALLSVVPVLGLVLAAVNLILMPAFYIMAINGIKDIPYSAGVDYDEKKKTEEPLDINSVRDYSQLFNKAKYGINFWFGLYYFLAAICSQIVINVFYFVSNKISLFQYFSISNMINLLVYPLLTSLLLVLLSHAIRNKILLSFLWGVLQVAISIIPFAILLLKGDEFYKQYIYSGKFLIQILTNFISAVLFILSISIFIRFYGLKLWTILLAVAVPSLLTNMVFYIAGYILEGKFDFNATGLVGVTVHILLFSAGVYFGLYQYVVGTQKEELAE